MKCNKSWYLCKIRPVQQYSQNSMNQSSFFVPFRMSKLIQQNFQRGQEIQIAGMPAELHQIHLKMSSCASTYNLCTRTSFSENRPHSGM